MYYVAWDRESGRIYGDAVIFNSREEAQKWYDESVREFKGIQEFDTLEKAQNEVEYQTKTSK